MTTARARGSQSGLTTIRYGAPSSERSSPYAHGPVVLGPNVPLWNSIPLVGPSPGPPRIVMPPGGSPGPVKLADAIPFALAGVAHRSSAAMAKATEPITLRRIV